MSFRTISVRLTGNASSLNSALYQASRSIDNFGLGMTRSGAGSLLKFGAAATLAGTAAYALGRALVASVRQAVAFDAAMRNVNSISGLSERQLGSLGRQVLDLSTRVPQSATNLANGLYQIASSGFQGAQGFTVLKAASVAASAGLTDTATSAQVIVGALNAYGLQADDATKVSDELFQTVNVGVLTFNDLAQGLGDVMGAASGAKVPLADVGAAVATMTRAGLVPAEAFTSLNRVIVSILQPSEALATVFKSLGYQSGAAALQTRGLHGVMEDLRKATGGSAQTMYELFTDIRGARGALALMSNQGQLYNDVAKQFTDQTQIQGRTLKTFNEQMKSVSAQWTLFKNRVTALSIEAATHLLPAISQLMESLTDLGHAAGGVFSDLAPFFTALRNVGTDLVSVFQEMLSVATPLAKAIAGLVGGAVIATLNELGRAVAGVTGFLRDHKTAVEAVAVVYLTRMMPALQVAAWKALSTVIVTLDTVIFGLAGALVKGAAGLKAFAVGLDTAKIAALGLNLVLAALTVGGFVLLAKAMGNSRKESERAEESFKSLTAGFSAWDPSSAIAAAQRLTDAIADADDHFNHLSRWQRGLAHFHFGPGAQDLENLDRFTQGQDELLDSTLNTYKNANKLAAQYGVLGQAVLDYAKANNIDLSKPWDESADAIEQVKQGLDGMAAKAGKTLPQLSAMAGNDIDAMQALADAIDKAGQAAAQAFAGATDVIQQFDPAGAAATVKAAQDQLTQAQKRLKDETAQYNAQKDKSISSDQQLRDARQGVADATKNLRDAQAEAANTGDLATIYRNDIAMGKKFVSEIQTAIKRGLDPQLVARLLQAGPEQAGPILDQLVSDHSGRLIKLANDSETTLSKISEQAVRIAQFTATAINAPLDKQAQLARDLPKAIALQTELFADGGKKSADALAKELHLKPTDLSRIATEYGITLPAAIQTNLDKNPVAIRVGTYQAGTLTYTTDASGAVHFKSGATAKAAGGYITGPGTTTSDSIPAWLSDREFVQPAKAVDYYGVPFMEAIRRLQLPRFAAGGQVSPLRRFADGGRVTATTTPTVVRVVEQPSNQSTRHEWNVAVTASDPRQFAEWAAMQQRRRSLGP